MLLLQLFKPHYIPLFCLFQMMSVYGEILNRIETHVEKKNMEE